ncbi:MAG: sigma-54-dependent Fis family transcriptional regulator [Myxococcales bacterium]|nr:sigma-54-dependent Fis family transcriptional regulator [Myxococcales bacterium]
MPRRVMVLVSPGGELDPLCAALEKSGVQVARASSEAELVGAASEGVDLALIDQLLGDGQNDGMHALAALRARNADLPVVMVADRGDVDRANAAVRAGAQDFLVRGDKLAERVATQITKLNRQVELADENRRLRAASPAQKFVSRSTTLSALFAVVDRIASIPRPVLVLGERGTGKELVARALHDRSGAPGPFVAVNCAAFSDPLLDAELFGFEKGSFTGADRRTPGKFELAHRGTLFLDEVANMSLSFQQKVLRTIEYGTFRRVGGSDEQRVSVRVVAATNVDLRAAAASGRFLSDLYDRLSFEVLRIPPLRERPEDIEPLALHFLAEFVREVPHFSEKTISAEALALLREYHFPGNARELKHIVERAAYRDRSQEIEPEDIGELSAAPEPAGEGSFKQRIEALERELVAEALAAEKDQRAAAKRLGLAYHQLRYYRKKYGL